MTSPQAQPPVSAAEELSDVQLLQMAAMATEYSSIEPGKCVVVSGSELIAYGYAVAAAARAALATQPEPAAAKGPSIEDVGPLMSWLVDEACQAADADQGRVAGMLTWAAQVIGEKVDEDAPYEPSHDVEGPSREELVQLACRKKLGRLDGDGNTITRYYYPMDIGENVIAFARAILARWGRPTAVPVPVSEGRPTEADCDEQGRCWWGENDGYGNAAWEFCAYSRDTSLWSHWLPAGALPVPPPENNTTPEP